MWFEAFRNSGYVGYQVSGSDQVKKAATAEKVAELEGKGLLKTAKSEAAAIIEKAKAVAEEIKLDGVAKAEALERLLEVAGRTPGGVEVLIERTRTEAITGFKGNVLSQGPTNPIQMMVDTEKKTTKTSMPSGEESDEKGEGE